jgi:hypothetical protein
MTLAQASDDAEELLRANRGLQERGDLELALVALHVAREPVGGDDDEFDVLVDRPEVLNQVRAVRPASVHSDEHRVVVPLAQFVQRCVPLAHRHVELGELLQADLDLVTDELIAFDEKDVHATADASDPVSDEAGSSLRNVSRAVLGGVDEAGLGPLLGPLVVAGTALEGPAGIDPWRRLAPLVCRDRPTKRRTVGGRPPLYVADSKKVHSGPHGRSRIERTALVFWSVAHGRDEPPATLGEWLRASDFDPESLADRPWYREIDRPLPLDPANDRDALRLDVHLLRRTLERRGVRITAVCLHPVDVVEFNRSIAATDNKSRTHFDAYTRVIGELVDRVGAGGHVVADRCGGLIRYGSALRRAWPERRVERIREGSERSSYTVSSPAADGAERRSVQLTFAREAEDAAFPTALASCFAKYLRETFMACINDWFAARLPDLRPTAGYTVDGRRFLGDVAALLEAEGIPRDLMVRAR